MDNGSKDSSHRIIKEHSATIIPFDTGSTLNDSEHANLKNTIWKQSKGKVDFVIVQDLDEFLFFPEYPNDIISGLIHLQKNKITLSNSYGYQMFCTDEEFDSFNADRQSITSYITKGCVHPSRGSYNKCILFDPNEIEEIDFGPGSHNCNPKGNVVLDTESTLLLHYKHIGEKYVIDRYKLIRDRLSITNKANGYGHQYSKTDDEIVESIQDIFTSYSEFNIWREMYKDISIIKTQYRGMQYGLHTFGEGDIISDSLRMGNVWEPTVAEKIYTICALPNTCYIDIGANLGTHVAIAKCAGAKQIYAFECNPNTASKLRSTIRINGWKNIDVYDVAISDKEGILPFTVVKDNIGASYIPLERKTWAGPLENGGMIRSCTFDSLKLDLDSFERILIKLDIEGHEIYALDGMKTVLQNKKVKNIILEINPSCSYISNLEAQIDILEEYGFIPAVSLFKVPGNEWYGKETDNSLYDKITKEEIMDMVSNGTILEVLFERV